MGADSGSGDDAGPPLMDIVVIGPGAPADAADRFGAPEGTDPSATPSIVYPLDGVLLPRNVYSPDVQWDGAGAAGDLYRVRFTGGPISLTAYVIHSGAAFRDDYVIDYPAWRSLLGVSAGARLSLTVDRWDSARDLVFRSTPVVVRIARGSIAGAVYYWALGTFGGTEGRILRVRQGTDAAPVVENFMPTPPAGGGGQRCAACHGLSRDGNRLAVSFDDGSFGGVVDLTEDLSGATPPLVFRFSSSWFFAAFDPTGTRLFMTKPDRTSALLDAATGAVLTPSTGALPSATHPAWSPDGNQLAFISSADEAWNPTTGDLSTISVTGADAFGAPAVLHTGSALAGAPEGGDLDAYPSYSPDSRFIAFGHGTRTLLSAGGASGALYVVPSGGGAAVRLDHASVDDAWYPNFTPFATLSDDGSMVYWLLFYSPRDYGNSLAGTRGSGRRQIWVSAVSTEPGAGADPSNVPYWLPGQDIAQENASAYWAPVPCRPTGDACTTDDQCCGGHCDASTGMCAPPVECRARGETCATTADCCEPGLACAGGLCVPAPF